MKALLFISLAFVAYFLGYKIGYKDCFDFLREKLKESKNHVDNDTEQAENN